MAGETLVTSLRRLLALIRRRAGLAVKKLRMRSHHDFEFLFNIACNDFGILQKKSEIKSLCDLVASTAPSSVCEIGSHRGGTSFLFARSFAAADKLIFVDRTIMNDDLLRFYASGSANLFFVEGDSCSAEVLGRINNILNGKPLDFLFIDGDHSYSGVKNDLITYYDLVRDGGYIAFHDIMPDYRTLYNQSSGTWSGEVYKLWQQVKGELKTFEFVEQEGQDSFGIGVIVKEGCLSSANLAEKLKE